MLCESDNCQELGADAITVFTEPQSVVRCSPALSLPASKRGPALHAALARVVDLRVREPRLKAKGRMSFVSRVSWQDQSLVITPHFFQPRISQSDARCQEHIGGLLAFDYPMSNDVNCIVDGSMYLMGVGLKVHEPDMCYLLETGWEEVIIQAMRKARQAGGMVPGQSARIPAQLRTIALSRGRPKRPKQAKQAKQAKRPKPANQV